MMPSKFRITIPRNTISSPKAADVHTIASQPTSAGVLPRRFTKFSRFACQPMVRASSEPTADMMTMTIGVATTAFSTERASRRLGRRCSPGHTPGMRCRSRNASSTVSGIAASAIPNRPEAAIGAPNETGARATTMAAQLAGGCPRPSSVCLMRRLALDELDRPTWSAHALVNRAVGRTATR